MNLSRIKLKRLNNSTAIGKTFKFAFCRTHAVKPSPSSGNLGITINKDHHARYFILFFLTPNRIYYGLD